MGKPTTPGIYNVYMDEDDAECGEEPEFTAELREDGKLYRIPDGERMFTYGCHFVAVTDNAALSGPHEESK